MPFYQLFWEVPLLKWTTGKSWYPCSNLSTGGPSHGLPCLSSPTKLDYGKRKRHPSSITLHPPTWAQFDNQAVKTIHFAPLNLRFLLIRLHMPTRNLHHCKKKKTTTTRVFGVLQIPSHPGFNHGFIFRVARLADVATTENQRETQLVIARPRARDGMRKAEQIGLLPFLRSGISVDRGECIYVV